MLFLLPLLLFGLLLGFYWAFTGLFTGLFGWAITLETRVAAYGYDAETVGFLVGWFSFDSRTGLKLRNEASDLPPTPPPAGRKPTF